MNKISKVNIINNTATSLHIIVNRDGIADIGSKLHCFRSDITTYNNRPASALHDVQPGGYQILSTVQANMKVSTLNNEACRGYKFLNLT